MLKPAKPSKTVSNNPDLLPIQLRPISINQLISDNLNMRPFVIDGILRRGETANIIASPKTGKSFLAGGLAWCVANGSPWLSHSVTQGRVLILDNELHNETLANRLSRIAYDMMIPTEAYGFVDVIPMRGLNIDIHSLDLRLAKLADGNYSLVVLDALYRTLPLGTSENDNAAMMAVYNQLDRYAETWNAAIAVVHHASKGAQGDKSVTDVGSGAGAISRAADTHIVIRPHEQPDLYVLECVTRSSKSPEPVSIKFEYPLWHAVTTEAEVKRIGRQDSQRQAREDDEACIRMLARITEKGIQQKNLFEQFDFGESKSRRLIGKLVSENKVKIVRRKRKNGTRQLVFYVKVTPNVTPEVTPEI